MQPGRPAFGTRHYGHEACCKRDKKTEKRHDVSVQPAPVIAYRFATTVALLDAVAITIRCGMRPCSDQESLPLEERQDIARRRSEPRYGFVDLQEENP